MIDAVLLDLGNVLVFHDNALLFRRLGEKSGMDAEEVARRFSRELWPPLLVGLDEAGIRAEVNRSLGSRLDADEFFEVFNSHFTVHDAILPMVSQLVGRVKLGLLSNTNAVHARWIRARLRILERFDAVLFSNEAGLAKPDPAFYRAALAQLGAEASRTVFFDDVPEYVEAARGLGMKAEVFTTAQAFARALAQLSVGVK